MRLIDADALYIEIMDRGIDGLQLDDLSEIQQVIADAPTIVPETGWNYVTATEPCPYP